MVAAGEENNNKVKMWVSPFHTRGQQKLKNGVSGYKLKATGGIIGIDYQLNDDLLLGATYSHIKAKINYQDHELRDKANTHVNIFSLYGLQYLIPNWFVEGVISYNTGKVKNNEGQVIVGGLERAIGKYTARTYNTQLVSGYNHFLSKKSSITPLTGIRYTKLKDGGYTETGTSYQNLTVKKRTYDKIE